MTFIIIIVVLIIIIISRSVDFTEVEVFPFNDGNARVNFRLKTNETFHYIAQYQKLSYGNTYHDVIEISHNFDDDDIKSSRFSYSDDYDSDSTPPSTPLPLSTSSLSQSSSPSSSPSSSASSSALSGNLAESRTEYWLTCVYVVKN
jgi:hypothetical protein